MGIYCIPSRLYHLHSHYNFPKCLRCGFLLILMVLVFPNSGIKLHDGYYNSLFGPLEDQPSRIKVESLGAVLKRHIQELRSTQNRQVDLVFLVDSSASVGPEDFRNEIKFVRKLLADFTVDHNTTRVAIVTFSSREKVVRHVDHLTQPTIHNHKCSLLMEEIPSIKYIGGGTYTLGAFLEAKQILRAARPDSMKAVILITDGFSNGGDPRPEARKLKSDGVKVFTFGIRNGNVRELYEMASEPRNETCYILNSFQEFEALARRALHSDLHMGTYIPQPPNMCSRLCTDDGLCCHGNASCMCGTHTGKYDCLCKPGHYGNGLGKDGCKLCPPGTYKNFTGAGDVSVCTPCPDENQITMPGATLIHECACKRGYRNFNSSECTVFRCPELFEPKNGYFVNSQCDNVFNAACGLRCRPGYELRGSSLRICQEDGSWSGQDTECVLKTCPALPVPKNGHMVCTTDDFSYPTVCRFTCQGGYQLLGSRKRSCLANALWTGIATRCREISCPPLPEIRDGAIQPSSCTEGEVRFGTTCQLSCLRGYKLRGPNTKQCTTDGTWSAASNEPNQCLDKTPPYIQCPENIQVAVDDDNDTVEVNWPVPVPVDNSGFLPVLTSDPAVAPPVRFPIDFITVTYKAEDLSHNVAKCKFYVLVIDETPPRVDKCKSPEPVVSSGSHGNVTWEEPLFTDNSGTPVEIIATHTPGLFPQGHTTVTYTAEDRHGNNSTCSLDIYVVPHPCQYPEAPANGKRECRESEEGVYCTLSCQPGFAFVETPPPEYFCAYNNIWTPADRLPFPDCAAQQISNEVLQPASITLSGDLSCTEHALLHRVEQNIEAKVNDKVTTLCEENVICEVDEIKVTCEENEDFNKIHSVGDLSNINVLPGLGRRHARSVGDTGHWLNYKSRASLKFDFMLEGTTNNTEDGEDLSVQQKKLSQSMTRLLSGLQAQAKQGHFDLYVGGRWLRFSDMDFDASRHTFSCPTGSVLLNNTCVNCPLGMFFHVMTSSCRSCPKGTYQPSEGQLACLVCPENTNTSSEHARNELECRAQCLPGSVSPTGLERCESCPEGFYQPSYAETACIACPEGSTTLRRGSRNKDQCRARCSPGHVSRTGLAPCYPCPLNTFQPEMGQVSCFKCPHEALTPHPAAIAITDCLVGGLHLQNDDASAYQMQDDDQQELVDGIECFENPCRNGGTCIPNKLGIVTCNCAPGFKGLFCQTTVNECEAAPCLNGGTCFPRNDSYTCTCPPGFTGQKCERNVDECDSLPCQNGGICVDGSNSYTCTCKNGFQGVNCENNVNDCEDRPCLNGGTCEDDLGSFRCTCPLGYSGTTCEIEVDECLSMPCKNNGTCVDEPSIFRCVCSGGYTGQQCEVEILECDSSPCQNGGKCEDLINSYVCHCQDGHTGRNCESEVDEDYMLDFPTASTLNYALIPIERPLEAFTVAFWVKTNSSGSPDTYGTPFSYAVAGSDNALTLVDTSGFAFYVNQESKVTDVTVEDGLWHHVAVSWSSNRGNWKIYLDGLLTDSGFDLSTSKPVPGKGVLVIGQEQDTMGGGFSTNEALVGSLTLFNIWDEELPLADIESMRTSCNIKPGNVVAWSAVKAAMRGTLRSKPSPFCKDCPVPVAKDFGSVNYTSLAPGGIATFQCARGFLFSSQPTSTCLVTSMWESDPPVCTQIECGRPGSIPNGYIEGVKFSFDNRVRFHCNKGYKLQGQETLYCNEYGEWEGEKPACVEITCTLPLLSENTVLITQKQRFKPGESANFRCTPGNKLLTLHSQVTCQRDGTWDRSVPTCDPQKCSSPPSISFGQANTSSQNFNVGEIVRYTCNIGYTLNTQGPNPSGAVTCLPTGEWERTLPECKIISCGEPPLVAHANTDGANRTFLSQIKYECQPGYAMQGHNKIECLEKGQWDPAPPRCLPVDCGPPPDLPRGQVEGTDFTYNAVVVSSCDPGHKILGEARRRCNESGQWEGVDPVCKPVSCGRPSAPANGKVFAPVITFQAQATYECVEGYTLQGVAFRECGEDGQWREAEPECTPVNCGPVIETENGTFQAPSTYTFGARVVYTCQNGFNMEGESELICLSTGYWSYEAPVCVPVECPIPTKPAFGKIKLQSFTTYTSKVEYECDDGYVLDGPDTRTCEADGSWSEQEPVCLPVMCEPPPPIDNGRYDYKDLKIGSIVRYFCDANYAMQGNEIRRCLSNLTLSGTEPVCQLITCERPEIPENGFLTLPDPQVLVMGSVVSYSCQEGHVLKGASVLRCGSNGLFNGSAPSCPPVECDRPTQVISNGRMLGTNFTFKSVISYECNEGYRLIGAKQRICKSNGEWDQPIPVCSVVECPRLVISNGSISTSKRDYGAVVTLTCRTGYRLEGSAERRCLVSGVWSGNDSVCLKKCPQLPSLQNGRYQRINETVVTYVCNEGYNLKGTNSSKCNSSGLWDPVPPKCVRITCSDLSNATLENGRVEFSSAVSGSFVQYVCNRGYNLFGSNRRVCSIAGHWVGEIPTCQVVSCNATGNPLNGIVKGSNFTYGAELNYDCDQGFVLVGLAKRVCQEDGQWSGEKPRCEIITCPGVETTLENGLVLTLSNTYGGTVQYSCNSGFALTGDNIRECLETGNWSSEAPVCVSLECSAPLSSQHMQVKGTDYRVGQKVQYTCNPGFEPLGPIDTTCLLNLTWSNPPPICDRVKCPDIPPLQNGVIVGEGRRYGDGVLHVCLPGYELIGQTSRVCQANGSWTGRESKCSPVSCGPPPSVLNAVANLENGTLFMSVIGYECNAGYYAVGNITTTCLENANWSAINFTCKLVNCIPITKAIFLNGSIQGELHSYGSEVGFICSEGFRLSGSNATVCKADGTWSNPVPSCHLVQCPEPQSIPNGHVTVSGYIFNSTAKYECEVGYQLNGNNVSTCMSDGLWSTDKRTCDKVTCQAPLDVIPHGLLLDRRDVYVYGDVVTYKCDSGYKTVGSELLACSANGDFVPTPPTCVKIQCPPVVPPVQGSVQIDNDTLVYSCVQGFELFGLERRRCTDTGQWEGVSPVCNPILCPNPELILNGHLTGNDFVFGSSVTYRCDTGFRLAGSSVITCLANGTWNSATPVCQRISCGPPQAVLSGNVVGKSFFYNDSVLYECHNGFLLSGPNERICLENGNWSGTEPLCEEILCDPPPNIANAVHDANDDDTFNVGFVVMYTCDLGHINYNSSIIICEEDRTWSDPLPSCSPVSCPYIPPPDHGHVTGDDITFNSEVHISCSPGYRLSSNGILTCMAHGEWDQNVPLCLQIVCPFPEIEHGGMHLEGQSQNVSLPAVILPGQVVIFTCDPGYRIGGALLSQCLDTGGWTNSPPVCLQVVCSTPPFVTHALRQDIGEFHAGGQVIYTCDPGYNMEGDSTLTCGNDGEWQGKNPLCIDIFCELPPMVENATELTIGAAVGEWVQYSCADGFKLEDGHSGRLSCLEGGVWSAELPVCLPVTCGQPPTISNAFYLERVEYLAGDVVIYTCLPGYEMEGQDTLTCGYDEQWKGLRPSCVDKTCDLPPFVENASTIGAQAETAAGDFVEYMCTDGFQLADGHDGLVVCLPGGFWSTDLPLCLPVTCSNPPNISNAFYLTEIYHVGDKANYICYQGYQMEIHGNLTCGYNGQWVGQLPHCIDMTCNEPPLVENANVTEFHTERRVGNWVQYVCSVGFTLQDGHDGRLFCLEGGIWSDRLPNCVHIDCGPPLAPIHARVKYTSTTAGSRANVTCDEGHQLLQGLQVMEIVCDISSTWADVERARCTPVECGQPPALAHTLPLANINTVFGSNITYHCIAGYVSTENATLFCSHNGSWTGHVPSCEPITCGPPEINASVQVIGSEFTLGSVLSLGCQDGLRLVGPSSITCQENGQWSSQTGHCEDFSTTVSGNNIILRADFQPCPIGYLRQGDLTSLNVDYQPPINGSCVRVSCGPPPVPDESAVKVFGRSYLYGDQVMFLCRPGLSPTRMPPTLTCTDTGHWDGEAACSAQCKLECQHGGRCVAFNRCKCLPGYTGTHCQLPICILPCLNGGTCSGPYGCTCQPGYFGSRCHKAICSRPCQNGGRCLHPDVCQCFNGFKPPFCESNYSLSVSKPLS